MTVFRRVQQFLGLLALALIPLECSRFDSSTDIGGELLNDLDPTIANPTAVLSYGKTEAPLIGTVSSRDTGNIRTTFVAVGALRSEFAYAYFEFDTLIRLPNARLVTRAIIRLDPTSTNINVSTIPLRFSVDTCGPKDSAAVLPVADIRRTYASVAFAKNASGIYGADSVVVAPAELVVELRRYYPGATFTDTANRGVISFRRTVTVDTAWTTISTSAWELASTDSVADSAMVAFVRSLGCDSTSLSIRPTDGSGAGGNAFFFDTMCYAHAGLAETLMTVRTAARHDTAFDTVFTLPGTLLLQTVVDSMRIDRVLTDTLVVVRRHRYDTLETRRVVQHTIRRYRLVLPDKRDFRSSVRLFADTLFRDSMTVSVTVKDTLELDSSGTYADIRYTARGALPVDSTHVYLRHRFFALRTLESRQEGLVRLWKPYLLLTHTDTAGKGVTTTRVECNYADYHVYERQSASRDTLAFCSAGARRSCRIALNMRPLWQTVRDSAKRCGLQTVLGAVAALPVASRWRESALSIDTVLYALTPDTALPTAVQVRGVSADTAGLVRFDLQRDLNALWNSGMVLGDTAYLHIWLQQTRDREWSTIEFAPQGSDRVLRVEFFLTAPTGEHLTP